MTDTRPDIELLRWYIAMGADEAIGWAPSDRLAGTVIQAPPSTVPAAVAVASQPTASLAAAKPAPAVQAPAGAAAQEITANSLAELEAELRAFEGCTLKRTATNTVFADGVPGAPLMIIGEAPGADEDRIGKPFVGRSGQLLDKMLAAINFSRLTNTYITNIIFWRPPGNRKPTSEETAACLPFVWRHIALSRPKILLLSGGTATSTLLGRAEGITRLRGRWFELAVPALEQPVPTLATYHPSFLLRAPGRKGEAWRDLLALQSRFKESQ